MNHTFTIRRERKNIHSANRNKHSGTNTHQSHGGGAHGAELLRKTHPVLLGQAAAQGLAAETPGDRALR